MVKGVLGYGFIFLVIIFILSALFIVNLLHMPWIPPVFLQILKTSLASMKTHKMSVLISVRNHEAKKIVCLPAVMYRGGAQ